MIHRGNVGKRAGLLLGALILAGCGGGGSGVGGGSGGGSISNGTNTGTNTGNGGGSSSSNGSGVEQSYGALTTRIVGTAQPPAVFYGSGGAVTGIAGASVTSLIQNRTITAPTLNANTKLAYAATDSSGNYQLFTMPAVGGTPTQITTGSTNTYYPTWSPDGSKIAFSGQDSTGIYQLFTMPAGGGTPTKITTGSTNKLYPSWSPDGTRIAYFGPDDSATRYNQLFTILAGGGTPTQITSGNQNNTFPNWSPDGTKIAYNAYDSASINQLFTIPSGGGSPTQITTGNQGKGGHTWSPDGTEITYTGGDSTAIPQLFTIPSGGGGTPTQITTGLAFKDFPSWSGFLTSPKAILLIGSGGLLASGAAGFLFAQSGDNVLSILTFDTAAATNASRAAARVAALTAPGALSPTNLIFSITAADSLSSLKFINYDSASTPGKVTAVSLPVGTTGALVSFNAATGKVTTVLPYAANRSAGSIGASNTVQASPHGMMLRGRFLAVFDGAGENRAPAQGASTVLLDAHTGLITAVQ